MKRKYNIEIPEDATIEQAAKAITNQFKKAKAIEYKTAKQTKRIGNGGVAVDDISLPQIDITITRVSPESERLVECNLCGTQYAKGLAFKYKTNYGGTTRKKEVCSKKCFEDIAAVCGDRVAPLRKKLKSIIPIN